MAAPGGAIVELDKLAVDLDTIGVQDNGTGATIGFTIGSLNLELPDIGRIVAKNAVGTDLNTVTGGSGAKVAGDDNVRGKRTGIDLGSGKTVDLGIGDRQVGYLGVGNSEVTDLGLGDSEILNLGGGYGQGSNLGLGNSQILNLESGYCQGGELLGKPEW